MITVKILRADVFKAAHPDYDPVERLGFELVEGVYVFTPLKGMEPGSGNRFAYEVERRIRYNTNLINELKNSIKLAKARRISARRLSKVNDTIAALEKDLRELSTVDYTTTEDYKDWMEDSIVMQWFDEHAAIVDVSMCDEDWG